MAAAAAVALLARPHYRLPLLPAARERDQQLYHRGEAPANALTPGNKSDYGWISVELSKTVS